MMNIQIFIQTKKIHYVTPNRYRTYKDDSKDCEDIYPIKMYKKNHEKATTRHVCGRRKSYKTERLYKWKK